jgi:hypothetical protein
MALSLTKQWIHIQTIDYPFLINQFNVLMKYGLWWTNEESEALICSSMEKLV